MTREERLQHLLNTLAEEHVSEVSNPWPRLYARLKAQRMPALQQQHLRLRALMGSGALLTLVITLVLLSPSGWSATVYALETIEQAIVGTSSTPTSPVTFQPTPSFVVLQPQILPHGMARIGERYDTNGRFITNMTSAAPGVNQGARAALLRARPAAPHLVIGYEATDTTYAALYQRAAKPNDVLPTGEARLVNNQPATLRQEGTIHTLTWIQENTWTELETNLRERELLMLASQLVVTQRPDETGSVTSEVPAIVSYELPLLPLRDAVQQFPGHVPQPSWLPSQVVAQGARVDPPDWLQIVYTREDIAQEGRLSLEIWRSPSSSTSSLDGATTEELTINGQKVRYQESVDMSARRAAWEADGYRYELSESNFGLTRDEFIRIAESVR